MRIFTVFLPLIFLSACGYVAQTSTNQTVTFVAPDDVLGAECMVMVDKRKYKVSPPQAVDIANSPNDMQISCHADDNKVAKLSVPAKSETRAVWGSDSSTPWNYGSQSLYSYPRVVNINFYEAVVDPADDEVQIIERFELEEELVPMDMLIDSDWDQTPQHDAANGERGESVSYEVHHIKEQGVTNSDDFEALPEMLSDGQAGGQAVQQDVHDNAPITLFPGH